MSANVARLTFKSFEQLLILALLLIFSFSCVLLLAPLKAEAAVAFGDVTNQTYHCQTSFNCNLGFIATFAAPVIAGSDTVLLIAVSINGLGTPAPLDVTYDGVSLGTADYDSGWISFTRTSVWVVTNPVSAGDIDVTVDISEGNPNGVITAAYYTGVDQTTTVRTPTTGTGFSNPASLSVTNSQTGDLIAGFFSLNDTSPTNGLASGNEGADQTYRDTLANSSQESQLALSDEPGASGTVTHSWDFVDDAGNGWAGVAIPLIAADATPATPSRVIRLLGRVHIYGGTHFR
jgi:hypothetical protein